MAEAEARPFLQIELVLPVLRARATRGIRIAAVSGCAAREDGASAAVKGNQHSDLTDSRHSSRP
eukprot:3007584-Rhodomonas_salina.3